jgi:superfamily II helicase
MDSKNRLCDQCLETIWFNDKRFKFDNKTICSTCYDEITSQTIKEVKPNNQILTPSYYWKGGIDVIEFAKMHFPKQQVIGFLRINALKYLVRYDEKGGVDDLDKSMNYTRMLKEMEEMEELT